MPVAAHDLAVEHVERGETELSCRGAYRVMGHGAAAAALHRQPRLGAVERLDLALLTDRQNQRVFGRIDIETDNILNLGGNLASLDS